jgi:hypothetical protein
MKNAQQRPFHQVLTAPSFLGKRGIGLFLALFSDFSFIQ